MIAYPSTLKTVGGARAGVGPANLLEVEDVNGNIYFWSDRKFHAPSVILAAQAAAAAAALAAENARALDIFSPPVDIPEGQQVAWKVGDGVSANISVSGPYAWQDPHHGSYGISAMGSLPSLPAGSVINAIIAVWKVASPSEAYGAGVEEGLVYGVPGSVNGISLLPENMSVVDVGGGWGTAGVPIPPGQYSISLGGDLSVPTGFAMGVTAEDTLGTGSFPGPFPTWFANLSASVALAVYYTPPSGGDGGSGGTGEGGASVAQWQPWLLSVPKLTFHRSLLTDIGNFVVQNLSGNSLSRDVENLLRASAFEGAFFVYRCYQADAQSAWLEVHGTLSVDAVGADTVSFKGMQLLNPSQEDTPLEIYCETCQLQWGGRRCGSTQATECSYSFPSCQVLERIMVVMNDYEKNYGEAAAVTAQNVVNRRRVI